MKQERSHKVYSNLESVRIEYTGASFRVVFSKEKLFLGALLFLSVWLVCAYFLFSKLATSSGPYKTELFVYLMVNAIAWGTPLLVLGIGYFSYHRQLKLGTTYLEIDLKNKTLSLPRHDLLESYEEGGLRFVYKSFSGNCSASAGIGQLPVFC